MKFLTLDLIVNIGTVDPKVLLELFSMYRDYQDQKAQKISKNQVFFLLDMTLVFN